ncbi:MAG TPA: hypothetical protein VND83_00125 [Acidimicrobiales bacterium]|nr:hypothetical protein [Acidimicrobiales bacterium]
MTLSPAPAVADRSTLDQWRGWIVLAALLTGLGAVVLIHHRPQHSFDESAHLGAWRSDLATVLPAHAIGCPFGYKVGVTNVPGVGAIDHVCVTRGTPAAPPLVEFFPVKGTYQLAHATRASLPAGQCSQRLGHGWWQVVTMSQTALGCPRGFSVDPAR